MGQAHPRQREAPVPLQLPPHRDALRRNRHNPNSAGDTAHTRQRVRRNENRPPIRQQDGARHPPARDAREVREGPPRSDKGRSRAERRRERRLLWVGRRNWFHNARSILAVPAFSIGKVRSRPRLRAAADVRRRLRTEGPGRRHGMDRGTRILKGGSLQVLAGGGTKSGKNNAPPRSVFSIQIFSNRGSKTYTPLNNIFFRFNPTFLRPLHIPFFF